MSEVRNFTGKLIRQAAWPSPQDYNEALQIPSVSFGDPVLKASVPEVDRFGLPRPNSGNFASVYKVHSGGRYYAVRCFLKDIVDQEQRYKLISDSVMNDDLPYTVGFEYQPEGILIRGSWYPILKMEWVEGATLDYFIETHREDAACIGRLAKSFFEMAGRLREAGVTRRPATRKCLGAARRTIAPGGLRWLLRAGHDRLVLPRVGAPELPTPSATRSQVRQSTR